MHSSSNLSSRNSLRTGLPKMANKAIGRASPAQPTRLGAANPANRDQTDTANETAEDNCQDYDQHHRSQRKSSKPDVLPANASDAELRATWPASALNPPKEATHRSTTRQQLLRGTEDTKSHDRSPSTISNQNIHAPLSASGMTGEIRQGRIRVGEIGNADFDGDDGQHTTASDCFEVKGVVGEPKSTHIKSVLIRHVHKGQVPKYSRGFTKRWT
jgi:hypothetical protein